MALQGLARTAAALRGTAALVLTGVYRFRTFEEADEWMTPAPAGSPRTSICTLIRTTDTRRPQDAIGRAFLEALVREREARSG